MFQFEYLNKEKISGLPEFPDRFEYDVNEFIFSFNFI